MFYKRKPFIIILLIIVGILVGSIIVLRQSKMAIEEHMLPAIEVIKVDLANLSSSKADLVAHIQLYNHIPVPVSIDSVSYMVLIANKEIATSIFAEPIHLKANGQSVVKIAVRIDYEKLDGLFERLHREGQDSTMMIIDAVLHSKLIPVGSAHISFKKLIPIFLMPKIEVKKLKIEKLTSSGAHLNINVLVKNENNMQFNFSDFKYTIKLEDHAGFSNTIPGTIRIAANDSTNVIIPLDLSFKEISQTLVDYIKKGKNLHYDITIVTKPQTSIYSFKNSEIILHSNGEIGTILKAEKK